MKKHPVLMLLLLMLATPWIIVGLIALVWFTLMLSVIPLRMATSVTKRSPKLHKKLENTGEKVNTTLNTIHDKVHVIVTQGGNKT